NSRLEDHAQAAVDVRGNERTCIDDNEIVGPAGARHAVGLRLEASTTSASRNTFQRFDAPVQTDPCSSARLHENVMPPQSSLPRGVVNWSRRGWLLIGCWWMRLHRLT